MTTEEYEKYVQSKIATPLNCTYLGLAGEVGEFLDIVKKTNYHGHKQDMEKEIKELGDVLFYLTDIITRRLGKSLQQVMEANKAKLDARYKAAFTQEESVNRKP